MMNTTSFLKILGTGALALILAVGCASTPGDKPAMEQTAAEQAIAAAKAAQKKAASVGGEWRDTGKFIKQAEAALKEGDHAKATKLANKARQEGELGYEQAMAEKDAGKRWTEQFVK